MADEPSSNEESGAGTSAEDGRGELLGPSVKAELEKVTVADAMVKDYPRLNAEKTVGDAWDLMEENQVDALPITEDDRVTRVITRNNIEIMKSIFFDAPGMEERQSRIMCIPLNTVNQGQELQTIKSTETLDKALALMVEKRIHSLPALDDAGAYQGMLTSHGIFTRLLK